MIEQDTVKLLRECDAGVKMGVSSLDEVLDSVQAAPLRHSLSGCKSAHEKLEKEIRTLLDQYQDTGKNPNPVSQSMSWVKTNMRLAVNHSDATVADLITDGCNMGVKSLSRYLNQYEAADETSKDIAKRLIQLEEKLASDVRSFL